MRVPFTSLFERRNIGPKEVLEMLLRGSTSFSGMSVNEQSSLRVSAVETCVSLISRIEASLPLKVYRRGKDGTTTAATSHWLTRVLHRPNAWQTRFRFLQTMFVLLLLHRNAYAWLNWTTDPRTGEREVFEMVPLHPSNVTIEQRDELAPPVYILTRRTGERVPIPPSEIFHLAGLSTNGVAGRSLIVDGRDVIGNALALGKHVGAFWSNPVPDVLLRHPKTLSEKAKSSLEAHWEATYGKDSDKRRVAVIEEGLEVEQLNLSQQAGQFVETTSANAMQLCGLFHVPPYLAGLADKQTSWGTGVEQQFIGFINVTIRPDLVNIEQQISRSLLGDEDGLGEFYAEFAVEGLLRGDSKSRGEFYRVMREIGVYSANDCRRFENMNPIPGGDTYLVPLNLTPMGAAPTKGSDADAA